MKIEGLILCGGEGSRYANSVRLPTPYPKHLESLGTKSILGWVIDGLVRDIPVSVITFLLNPKLKNEYLRHIKAWHTLHPNLPFSFFCESEIDQDLPLLRRIQKGMQRGVYNFAEELVDIGDPIIALAHGDTVMIRNTYPDLREVISNWPVSFDKGLELSITDRTVQHGRVTGGTYYFLKKLSQLTDFATITTNIHPSNVGLNALNINDRSDLALAKDKLNIPLTPTDLGHVMSKFLSQ